MAKYDPLREYLLKSKGNELTLTFKQIESIIGSSLSGPKRSAYSYRPWWGNDKTHVQARAWLDAGWKVDDVNLQQQKVIFKRKF